MHAIDIRGWKEQPECGIRICAFGSSNTALSWEHQGNHNWVDWLMINLRDQVGPHVSVTNLGVGGETTVQLLARVDRDVRPLQPTVVIITIGGNDAVGQMTIHAFERHLTTLCNAIQGYGALPVLQTYYCPLYHLAPTGFEARFESFMAVKRALAASMQLPLIDQHAFFSPLYRHHPETYEHLMRDWLHLNHLGNLAMAQYISQCFGLPAPLVPAQWNADFSVMYEQLQQAAARPSG